MTMEVIIKYKSKKAISNLEYKHWLVQDKQLLGYLLNSMKEVLVQVDTLPSFVAMWIASRACSRCTLMHGSPRFGCNYRTLGRTAYQLQPTSPR
jgi:hypothetical protein